MLSAAYARFRRALGVGTQPDVPSSSAIAAAAATTTPSSASAPPAAPPPPRDDKRPAPAAAVAPARLPPALLPDRPEWLPADVTAAELLAAYRWELAQALKYRLLDDRDELCDPLPRHVFARNYLDALAASELERAARRFHPPRQQKLDALEAILGALPAKAQQMILRAAELVPSASEVRTVVELRALLAAYLLPLPEVSADGKLHIALPHATLRSAGESNASVTAHLHHVDRTHGRDSELWWSEAPPTDGRAPSCAVRPLLWELVAEAERACSQARAERALGLPSVDRAGPHSLEVVVRFVGEDEGNGDEPSSRCAAILTVPHDMRLTDFATELLCCDALSNAELNGWAGVRVFDSSFLRNEMLAMMDARSGASRAPRASRTHLVALPAHVEDCADRTYECDERFDRNEGLHPTSAAARALARKLVPVPHRRVLTEVCGRISRCEMNAGGFGGFGGLDEFDDGRSGRGFVPTVLGSLGALVAQRLEAICDEDVAEALGLVVGDEGGDAVDRKMIKEWDTRGRDAVDPTAGCIQLSIANDCCIADLLPPPETRLPVLADVPKRPGFMYRPRLVARFDWSKSYTELDVYALRRVPLQPPSTERVSSEPHYVFL